LKTDLSAITATQAAEVVKNSEKQRKDSVSAAEKQYNETVMNLQMQRDELGIISEEQYQKLKNDVEKTRNDAVKNAQDMHKNVVSEAKKQAGEHVEQVNWETGEVKTKWRMLKEDVGRSVRETAESIIKIFNEMFTGVKKRMREVETTVKKSWEAAKKVFSVDSMVQIGGDVINGLIKGIGEKCGGQSA